MHDHELRGGRVRPVAADDLDDVVEVVVEAFTDYPYWVWLEPDRASRVELMRPYYRDDLAAVLSEGSSMGAARGGAAALDAVALWWWADGDGDAVFDSPAVSSVPGSAGDRLARAMAAMADLAPAGPHWYLDVLATRSVVRGRGLGATLLRHGLARADDQDATVYLETSDRANVGLYEHFGFEVTGEMTLEGLWLCGMTRPPRPTGVA